MPKVPELKILYRGNGADLAVDDVTADLVMRLPTGRWKSSGSKSWTLPGLRSARISFMKHFRQRGCRIHAAHGGRQAGALGL